MFENKQVFGYFW